MSSIDNSSSPINIKFFDERGIECCRARAVAWRWPWDFDGLFVAINLSDAIPEQFWGMEPDGMTMSTIPGKQTKIRISVSSESDPLNDADVWQFDAPALAQWAWCHLVNRVDVWGGYTQDGVITDPPKKDRGLATLTTDLLSRHFAATKRADVIGLHSIGLDNTCRWAALDLDNKDKADAVKHTNLVGSVAMFAALEDCGFRPLLVNHGEGSLHLWILFSEPVPSATAFQFLENWVGRWKDFGLSKPPESFPKQAFLGDNQLGNWLRLPGRHHSRDTWPKVWDGTAWLTGQEAVEHILNISGDDPALLADFMPRQSTEVAEPMVAPQKWRQGERYPHLQSLAGGFRRMGVIPDLMYKWLTDANELTCEPPLEDGKIRYLAYELSQKWKSLETKETEVSEIEIYQASGLDKEEFPEVKMIYPNILPGEGAILLVGRPKMGKSWMALNIAASLANPDIPFLGHYPSLSGDVLFLALEDTKRRMKKRTDAMALGRPDRLFIAHSWPCLGDGCVEGIVRWIKRSASPVAVIIDTLAKVRRSRTRSVGVYEEDYRDMAELKGIADEYKLCVVIITHLRKAADSDPVNMVTGSAAISGAADAIIILDRIRGRKEAKLCVYGRDIEEEQDLALNWDGNRAIWTAVGNAAEYELSQSYRNVLQVLLDNGESMKPSEIAVLIGKSRNTTKQICWKMEKTGWLTVDESGRYLPKT